MRWDLADEQEMFRDSFAGWLADHASSEAVRGWLDTGDAAPFDQRMAADGWLGVGFSEEAGGQGGGLLELALAAEQLGYAAAPGGSWLASVLAAPALAVRPDVSAAVLEQGEPAALAVTAGRPPDEPGPVVAKDGALHGTVRGVLGASHARHFVVPVWADSQCTLFLAAADEPAISRAGRKLLDRSRSAADVTFTGVPAQPLDADGRAVLAEAALRAAVLVAADSLGAAARMLRLAVDYSQQRTQFGVPIGSFQAVKHAAAMMLVAVESSRSITYFAAASVEQGSGESGLHAAAAKAQVTAAAEQAADSALTLHGAIGYTWEHDLQLFYKRAKLNAYLFGTPQVWNERLASALPLLPGR
jgi:alkylation response protein AidB-like acyl-CoA dehydrogenase